MDKHRRNSIPHEQKTLIGRSIELNENVIVPIGPVTLARIASLEKAMAAERQPRNNKELFDEIKALKAFFGRSGS